MKRIIDRTFKMLPTSSCFSLAYGITFSPRDLSLFCISAGHSPKIRMEVLLLQNLQRVFADTTSFPRYIQGLSWRKFVSFFLVSSPYYFKDRKLTPSSFWSFGNRSNYYLFNWVGNTPPIV